MGHEWLAALMQMHSGPVRHHVQYAGPAQQIHQVGPRLPCSAMLSQHASVHAPLLPADAANAAKPPPVIQKQNAVDAIVKSIAR